MATGESLILLSIPMFVIFTAITTSMSWIISEKRWTP